MNWLFVLIGGGLGSLSRWMIFQGWFRLFPQFPPFWATLIVNVLGCFAIGCMFSYSITQASSENFKLFWMIGFLGGLTTFSAFGLDLFQMIQHKTLLITAGYFLLHGLICISMVYLGYTLFQLR